MTSPYLQRPLRSLEQVLWERRQLAGPAKPAPISGLAPSVARGAPGCSPALVLATALLGPASARDRGEARQAEMSAVERVAA